ncbi:hypothetical protein [Paenibacillus andongensis]|uniref:hypothetical protein n=1 Tax=Paenibacillus andongensis TaxID=2975482 RepID=UPI0021BB4075|nr:hypothetical protein [Paenibacillus andongensis]
MNQSLKKGILTITFILMVLVLCSCGARVSTSLTMNKDFSGERVITSVVSKSEVNDKFKGGTNKIDEILINYLPPELTYTKTEDANNFTYTLRLPFASLEEYKQKVNKLIGREAKILVSTPNNVFASGVVVSEDFNSIDLLEWFRKAVENEKLVDDTTKLWELGDTSFTFNGKPYLTGANININDIMNYPIDKISVNTTKNVDGSFSRNIKYVIPNSTYNAKTEDINNFMKSIVPQGDTGAWTNDNGKTFTITYNAKDTAELSTKTSTALSSKLGSLKESNIIGKNPFHKYMELYENLDFSAFASDSRNRVNIEYKYMAAGNDSTVAQRNGDNVPTSNTNTFVGNVRTGTMEIRLVTERKFPVSSIHVTTAVQSATQISKHVTVTYADNVPSEAGDIAKLYVDSLNIPNLTSSVSAIKSGQQVFEFGINGNIQEVNGVLTTLFGKGNAIQYSSQKYHLVFLKGNYTESVNLTEFMSRIGYNKDLNYTINGNAGETIKQLSITGKSLQKDIGKSYTTSIPARANISYTGSKLYWTGVLLVVVICLILLVGVAFGLLLLIKRLSTRDGLTDKELKALVVHYGGIAWRKTIALFVSLKELVISLIQISDKARMPVVYYFHGSKWPVVLVLLTILQVPRGLGALIGKLFSVDHLGLTFSVLTLIAALVWFLVERFRVNAKSEALIDSFIESDLRNFKERALLKLGVVEEQVCLIDQIKVTGPYNGFSDSEIKSSLFRSVQKYVMGLLTYMTKLVLKNGSDDKIRYSLVKAQIYLFNDTQIYVYEVCYDLCNGEIFEESTMEYFYQNVVNVLTGEKLEEIITRSGIIKKRFEFFKVMVSSGEFKYALVDTERSILENQVMAMRNLIRDKKNSSKQRKVS